MLTIMLGGQVRSGRATTCRVGQMGIRDLYECGSNMIRSETKLVEYTLSQCIGDISDAAAKPELRVSGLSVFASSARAGRKTDACGGVWHIPADVMA